MKGDNDRAIADYNEAIRLQPGYALAYNNRGGAYVRTGDFDRAINDYTEAIRINPMPPVFGTPSVNVYYNRGSAYAQTGDGERAVADFTEAIRLEPKRARPYYTRGIVYLATGATAKAAADFKQASELEPNHVMTALWRDVAERRSGEPGHLAQSGSVPDNAAWPAPLFRLFLGDTTSAAVLAAADDPDPIKRQAKVCEANFFSGELALLTGATDEAERLFWLAATDCPHTELEWGAAKMAIKTLGAKPPG
jgi:tetratricopeptide (TPR) repeat protein